jgi:hypothetical protein
MGLRALGRWLPKEHPAQSDAIPSMTVGEKAEVTHAVEAGGKQVQEKSPDELVRMKAHDLLAITSIAPIILPSEGNMVVIKFDDAAVGDSEAMGVSAEIGEHLVRTAERRLCIDDPFDAARTCEMAAEHGSVVEMGEVVEEVQFALSESFGESSQKEPAEQA